MRTFVLALAFAITAAPVWANARITLLMDALRIEEVVEILRIEGFAHSEILNADMLDGRGGAFWDAQIRQIYDAEILFERIRQALTDGLETSEIDALLTFYGSPEGQQIVSLENAARRAMAHPAVEQSARDAFTALEGSTDAHLERVQAFIAGNDLLARNLSGTMSAHVQFYKGLSDGRYLIQSEGEILAEVWSQQEDIRTATMDWVNGFILMAYQPLDLAVLDAHVAFSMTPAGQALNSALFDGFESANLEISYALGRAVALNARGDEI